MFLDLDFPDVTVDVLADIVAPHEGDRHQEQQLADTIQVREMRVFDVEACALQGSEHRLDFPAPAVGFHRFVMAVERHNHLKLRHPVPPLDTPGGEVAGLPFDVVNPRGGTSSARPSAPGTASAPWHGRPCVGCLPLRVRRRA